MDVKEFYEAVNGDYDEALERLGSDALMLRFINKFLQDETMNRLRQAVTEMNVKESFQQAHTLKGLAGNLSFMELYNRASDLTEQLRPLQEKANQDLYDAVELSYERVSEAIKELNAE